MSRLASQTLAMLLMLAAFPLISFGTTSGPPLLWWLGLAALGVGGAIPPVRRFVEKRQAEPPPTAVGLADDERVS